MPAAGDQWSVFCARERECLDGRRRECAAISKGRNHRQRCNGLIFDVVMGKSRVDEDVVEMLDVNC